MSDGGGIMRDSMQYSTDPNYDITLKGDRERLCERVVSVDGQGSARRWCNNVQRGK